MMIGSRFYIGDGTADAAKSLTHDGSDLPAIISTAGFSPNLYRGPWTVTAWLRAAVVSAQRDMYAFVFGGVGPYLANGESLGMRYSGASTYLKSATVNPGSWFYVSIFNDCKNIFVQKDMGREFNVPVDSITPVDRLALLDDDYGRLHGAWHGDITRICIFPRSLSARETRIDMSARGAAPVGAAHWWDFADAESGVATDRIGGVRLQIPPGFVTRATPWSS